jgi:hypothetical protein
MDLFADCTFAGTMKANQLQLWFASMAYVLLEGVDWRNPQLSWRPRTPPTRLID